MRLGSSTLGAACGWVVGPAPRRVLEALLLLARAVLLGGFLMRHAEEFGYEVARSRR